MYYIDMKPVQTMENHSDNSCIATEEMVSSYVGELLLEGEGRNNGPAFLLTKARVAHRLGKTNKVFLDFSENTLKALMSSFPSQAARIELASTYISRSQLETPGSTSSHMIMEAEKLLREGDMEDPEALRMIGDIYKEKLMGSSSDADADADKSCGYFIEAMRSYKRSLEMLANQDGLFKRATVKKNMIYTRTVFLNQMKTLRVDPYSLDINAEVSEFLGCADQPNVEELKLLDFADGPKVKELFNFGPL